MSTSKRHHQSSLIEDKNISNSTIAFIETPTTSISQTTDNHLNNLNHQQSSQTNHQLIDWQEHTNGFHHENSRSIQDHFDSSRTRTNNKQTNVNRIDRTQNDNEDDWVLFNFNEKLGRNFFSQVCPVAVALRRAGYDVCIMFNLFLIISSLNRYH